LSSKGIASPNPKPRKPTKSSLPADDVQAFRKSLAAFLDAKDDQGRTWSNATWGVYAFYDYDGEPIYVGQTNEKLRTRIRRHLTNQRSDAVAMRILDVFEVAEAEVWPLWHLEGVNSKSPNYADARSELDAHEYTAYLNAIENSRLKAILNEKIPPVSETLQPPPSLRWNLIDDETRQERQHPDIRIARRAETVSRLAAVARERGEVSEGLRRVLVIQALRLALIAAERLAYAEGRPRPDASAIFIEPLVGSVLYEFTDPYGGASEGDDES
jgi:hypothetical protein